MTQPIGPPPDYSTQLRANWAVVSNPASLKAAGITVQQPTPTVVASLPAIATAAVAAAGPPGTPPLQIAKYVQVVNTSLPRRAASRSSAGRPR
jgi:hypothetical protein